MTSGEQFSPKGGSARGIEGVEEAGEMATRLLKSHEGITLTEVTQSDGQREINRAYSVRTKDPTEHRTFGDMGSAETYFEERLLRRLNPNQ